MKAFILAAGLGSRLFPYTKNLPKCMVKISGISLIERQIQILNKMNINDIIIIGGYKYSALEKFNLPIIVNHDYETTNMLWTLFCAEEEFNNEFIVSYGDIIYNTKNLKKILNEKSDISITVDTNWLSYWKKRFTNPLDDAETLKINSKNFVKEIGFKPRSLNEIDAQYMGLMKFRNKGVDSLRLHFQHAKKTNFINNKNIKKAYMTDMLQSLILSNIDIKAVKVQGGWVEIDTVEDFLNPLHYERIKTIDNDLKK